MGKISGLNGEKYPSIKDSNLSESAPKTTY